MAKSATSIKPIFSIFLLVVLTMHGVSGLKGQNRCEPHRLFTISRSRDVDEIHYEIRFDKSGNPDKKQPIDIYWERKSDNNNVVEPLSWVQSRYAYGIKYVGLQKNDNGSNENACYSFQFVSYNKRTFTLKNTSGSGYKVYTTLGGKEVELSNIYVQFGGGTFWLPVISKVELKGVEPHTGEPVTEYIVP